MSTHTQQPATGVCETGYPRVLPMRQRSEVIHQALERRLESVLPLAMREAELDMWIVLCQEDNPDPVYTTLIPMDTWSPILQMLVFYDRGDGEGVERINISGTETHGLYQRPYRGQIESEQWPLLRRIVEERDPQRIGIDTGSIQWAAGGLTHTLYNQLTEQLPARYVERLTSAEALVTRWLATLTDYDLLLFDHVVRLSQAIIAECYSRRVILPGVTTTDDLRWHYWQRCADLGVDISFRPHFGIIRSPEQRAIHGEDDAVIRPGDLLHCDVGLHYLRLNSDHQQSAYVLRQGESDAPDGLKSLMAACTRLQNVFMSEFKRGLTGNELLANILDRARSEGLPAPKVYSHSLGFFLHEPGPLIGLPWEQERCVGRGDVLLEYNYAFTMELSVAGPVPEWSGQQVRLGQEEDVAFTEEGCRPIHSRQRELYLV
jgi:Xaa-Pro aminopeptidase